MRFPKPFIVATVAVNRYVLRGEPDQSVCAHLWQRRLAKPTKLRIALCRVVDTIFFFDPQHCRSSYYMWRFKRLEDAALNDLKTSN